MQITAIKNTQWRNDMLPASFRGRYFHCASNATAGGQRVITHEFPKKDYPYTERLGRHATQFSVRGYIIVFPHDITGDPLKKRDYRQARDALKAVLDDGQEGLLQLPTQQPMTVVCSRYSLAEEERFGGYCTFDMTFVELGTSPLNYTPDTQVAVIDKSQDVRWRALEKMNADAMTPSEKILLKAAVESGSSVAVASVWKKVLADHSPSNPALTNPGLTK